MEISIKPSAFNRKHEANMYTELSFSRRKLQATHQFLDPPYPLRRSETSHPDAAPWAPRDLIGIASNVSGLGKIGVRACSTGVHGARLLNLCRDVVKRKEGKWLL
jgi:hypothetical protein